MRRLILLIAALVFFSGCTAQKDGVERTTMGMEQTVTMPAVDVKIGELTERAQELNSQYVNVRGKVLESVNTSVYTYIKLSDGTGEVWVALPKLSIETGKEVTVPSAYVQIDFYSTTLNTTLDVILLAERLGDVEPMAGGTFHGTLSRPPLEVINVTKLEDGYTVEEIYKNKEKLRDSVVRLRGVVVRVSPNIMDRTWIHVQDGTGDESEGTHDIAVTYAGREEILPGDTVIVEGRLSVDKDIGAGYVFKAIIEDAKIEKEE
ncbi:hypothetical protein [Candidatus Pyrohabitans sp.]